MKLTDLKENETLVITHMDFDEKNIQRLRSLGFMEGGEITLFQRAPLHDPSLYLAMGSMIALRKQDSEHIEGYKKGEL